MFRNKTALSSMCVQHVFLFFIFVPALSWHSFCWLDQNHSSSGKQEDLKWPKDATVVFTFYNLK
jgi:hypothetical protein